MNRKPKLRSKDWQEVKMKVVHLRILEKKNDQITLVADWELQKEKV